MGKNADNIKRNAAEQRAWNKLTDEGKSSYREFQGIFESIAGELGNQVNSAQQAKKEYNSLVSLSRKLADNNEELSKLSDKQLYKQQELAASSLAEIKRITEKIKLTGAQTDEEEALLLAKGENFKLEEDLLEKINEQIKLRIKANELMGVAGGLLKGLNKIAGPFASALKLDKVEEDMQKVADATAKSGASFGRMRVLAAGVGSAIANAFSTLTDPAVIIGSIVKSMGALADEQKKFRQITGQNIELTETLNTKLISSTDYLKGAVALTKELGINAAVVFTPETIAEVAELTENMGLGAKEAANLAKFAKLGGKELSTVTAEMEASFISFTKTNKVGLNMRDVMAEVGNASSAVSLSLGSSTEKIQEAVMEAQKLGLSLEQVDKIAGSLLDFESSIEAEMEAELLTGRQINLDKARLLALNNDLAGVAKEIGKNQGVLSAFASGNRIAQEATAKAMGMSRDEMANMIYQQGLANDLTEEQAAKAANISTSEAKRLTAQETIAKTMEKMSQFAASLLDKIMPILDNTYLLEATMLAIGVIIAGKMVKGLKDSYKEMKGMVKSSISFLKNTKLTESILGKKFKGGQFMTGGGQAKAGGQRAGGLVGKVKGIFSKGGAGGKGPDIAEGLPEKTKGMDAKGGAGSKGFLQGLGDGLASIGKQMGNVIKGAVALGIAGLVFAGAFALAMMMIKDVDPIQMIAFAASMSILGLTVAVLGLVGGNIIAGALAMGILALALIPAAYAFSLLKDVDTDKMIAFSLLLPLLGLAMAGLGFIAPFVMAGALALGFMALALVPLALMGPGLSIAATALTEMAASLREVGSALGGIDENKLEALEDFAITSAVTGAASGIMAAIVSPITALGGMLGGEGENPQQQVVEKLDQLIAIVEKGGDVILDGNKVGRNLAMASSKMG